MVEIGKGTAAFGRGGFADAAAAAAWGEMAAGCVKPSTIRLGPRRILGTMAEALRRWAIDQGTLPMAEGGTHLAPVQRLSDVMADPACTLPLAALDPDDLSALRARRLAALSGEAAMLAEQAALAAAIDALRDLHLPQLRNPFRQPAPDGVTLLHDDDRADLLLLCSRGDTAPHRAAALLLTTGIAPALLLSGRYPRREVAGAWLPPLAQQLLWPAPPHNRLRNDTLDQAGLAAGIAQLGAGLGLGHVEVQALWLTGLVTVMRDGLHLDEALVLAGLHHPATS
jgi:hypothetical protein